MTPTVHRIYISVLSGIVVFTTILLVYKGVSYYSMPLEERFYHPDHANFKPSGLYGQGLGIIGTLLILFGVVMYIVRKRYRFLDKFGRLKYWLEFHIFLCSLGPVMVLFHTAFKFGGIVSVAFWSMVAVVASGVIGRFIYIQIPRTIEGRELSLGEVRALKTNLGTVLKNEYQLDEGIMATILQSIEKTENVRVSMFKKFFEDRKTIGDIKKKLRQNGISRKDIKKIVKPIKNEMSLNNKISRLQTMKQLFKYWHVAHMPFAIIMLVIVLLHVGVTVALGYRWIF